MKATEPSGVEEAADDVEADIEDKEIERQNCFEKSFFFHCQTLGQVARDFVL